jgi:hypothetical protein
LKTRINGLLMVLVLIACNSAFAANSWKNNVPIVGLYNVPTGGFLMFLPPGTDPACGPSSNLFYVLPGQNGVTADGAKAALAIALTAFTLGKTVNILYDNTISNCPIQIVWINP